MTKKLLLPIVLVGFLAGCTGEGDKAQQIRDFAKENCGVGVTLASAGVLLATSNPLASESVKTIGTKICDAFKAQIPNVQTLTTTNGIPCVLVAGVCITADSVDKKKLEAYQPKETPKG